MKNTLKKAMALVLCVSLAACTSMRVVADGQSAVKSVPAMDVNTGGLKAGDTLLIVGRDARQQTMNFEKLDGAALVGTVDGKNVRIALDDVERIERNEVSVGKTLGLVFGVLGAVALIAANAIGHDVAALAPKPK